MRITQNYSINSLLERINDARERIYTLQRNLATGKRINTLSDDPENIEAVLRYKKLLKTQEKFQQNIGNALDFMYISSQALDDAAQTLAHAKELALKGINNTDNDAWAGLAEQVNQLLKEMVDISNTRFQDRYVFGGTFTSQKPFQLSADETAVISNPNGVNGHLKIEYGVHAVEQYNITGQDAFLQNVDVFQVLIDLRDALTAQDVGGIQGVLDKLDQATNQIIQQNGALGGLIQRFELYLEQYQNQEAKLQEFLSRVEDTDMAEAISELQLQETGLNAALEVLARTLNISLMDFIS
ncbi:MAG: flagellar hook-associated protein FlgL [Calditrichia bacterium]